MAGNMMFPVVCFVVLSISVQLIVAQPPPHFMLGPPRPSPRSWGRPNEILGSGPTFRPPPGLLIAGHGPPVSRHLGPARHGGRPYLPLPLVTSTTMTTPSVWPSHGAQIQRAQEGSHFEYEVMPRFPKPPTHFRGAPTRLLPRPPIPTQMPTNVPTDMYRVLARDAIATSTSGPRPQISRSSNFPPPFAATSPPHARPPYATPSDADFQEGFRILNDVFMEEAGADIRNNLVGGSDVSFSGGYFPPMNNSIRSNSAPQQPTEKLHPSSQFEITPANEQGILLAGSPPKAEASSPEELNESPSNRDQKFQGTDVSYGPPSYKSGTPQSHVSFMFSDPNEPRETYNIYNEGGYERGPPPPFHTVGNSIIPPSLPRQPQEGGGSATPPQNQPQPQQNGQPQSEGGYNNAPQQNKGGYSNSPAPNSAAPKNAPIPMPMMMMPLGEQPSGNEPLPSSEEVQKALGILARYASKQAQSMGMSTSPQMMMQMMQPGSPNNMYGKPQERQEQVSSPSSTYGSPSPQQITPVTNFLSLDVTPPPFPSTISNSGSSSYSATTEVSDAITISDSPREEYGAPQLDRGSQAGYEGSQGGYNSAGGSSGGSQGGYNSAGGSSGGSQGGYSSGGGSSGGSQGGYSSAGGSSGGSQGGYSSGGGWGSGSDSGSGGAANLIGAKVNALKSIGSAVTGGIQQVGALKAGILNAGLNVIGGLGRAKGDLANSLKIPIMPKPQNPVYGPPSTPTTTTSTMQPTQYGPPDTQYGPPDTQYGTPEGGMGWGSQGGGGGGDAAGLLSTLVNAGRGVVGGIAGTVAASGKAAVGIGLSKNDFVKNHFVIKGQAFTDLVSKKVANKNDYFQNVMKHIASIFNASSNKPSGGWSR